MIKTDRLLIHGVETPSDELVLTWVGWLNDPRLMRFSEQRHLVHTLESQLEYIDKQSPTFRLYNLFMPPETATVGTMTLHIDLNNNVGDMGILIGKEFAGQGYGMEAWYGLYDHLLLAGDVRKIEAGHMQSNRAMFNICRKRMRWEGARKHHFVDSDGFRSDKFLWGSQ